MPYPSWLRSVEPVLNFLLGRKATCEMCSRSFRRGLMGPTQAVGCASMISMTRLVGGGLVQTLTCHYLSNRDTQGFVFRDKILPRSSYDPVCDVCVEYFVTGSARWIFPTAGNFMHDGRWIEKILAEHDSLTWRGPRPIPAASGFDPRESHQSTSGEKIGTVGPGPGR